MKAIYSLLKDLNKRELKVFDNYLRSFTKIGKLKSATLMELLSKGGDVSLDDEVYSQHLYGCGTDKRLLMLKNRFKNKLLDTLLLDINLDRRKDLDERDLVNIKVKKKLAQILLYRHSRGEQKSLQKVLDEAIKLSEKYELYNELIEAIGLKKYVSGFRSGMLEFNYWSNLEVRYRNTLDLIEEAKSLYYKIQMLSEFKGNKTDIRKQAEEILKNNLITLQVKASGFKSSTLTYYLIFLNLIKALVSGNYGEAKSLFIKYIDVIQNNKSVYRKSRMGSAYVYKFDIELALGNYMEALVNIRKANEYFAYKSTNYFISLENEFFTLFYLKKFDSAHELINKIIKKSHLTIEPFWESKYQYLLANTLFAKKKFVEVLSIIDKNTFLFKDKNGWNTYYRILEIMTLLELEMIDQAFLHIERLRKHVAKYSKHGVETRELIILKMLIKAETQGFNFKSLKKHDFIPNYQKLCENISFLSWEVKGPELIPFHIWIDSKMALKDHIIGK